MHITNIQDALSLFQKKQPGKVISLETSVFYAYFLWLFLPNFEIITYRDGLDIDTFKKRFIITTLDKDTTHSICPLGILQDIDIQQYIQSKHPEFIFIRKPTSHIEDTLDEIWCSLLWNKSDIREPYEDKKRFRTILEDIWIAPISWKNILLEDFILLDYEFFKKSYWKDLVIQLPEIKKWWWVGTIFIHNNQDFIDIQKKLATKTYKGKQITNINITKYIVWVSASIIWCTTKYWTLTNIVQTQIIDIPEVNNSKKWSWLFCWHDWSFKHYSSIIQKKADIITQKIWNHMYQHGYKWIFWLDFIITEQHDEIYVVECNSRYTWAMPMLSMLDMANDTIPMDIFHIIEHLNLEYSMDFDIINQQYKKEKHWSHIILSNIQEWPITCKKELLSGVYAYEHKQLVFKREGYEYRDIQNDGEFVITDGNPRKGQIIKWYTWACKICHLLFPKSILASPNTLKTSPKQILQSIYTEVFHW